MKKLFRVLVSTANGVGAMKPMEDLWQAKSDAIGYLVSLIAEMGKPDRDDPNEVQAWNNMIWNTRVAVEKLDEKTGKFDLCWVPSCEDLAAIGWLDTDEMPYPYFVVVRNSDDELQREGVFGSFDVAKYVAHDLLVDTGDITAEAAILEYDSESQSYNEIWSKVSRCQHFVDGECDLDTECCECHGTYDEQCECAYRQEEGGVI